jgi:hypothetical protein
MLHIQLSLISFDRKENQCSYYLISFISEQTWLLTNTVANSCSFRSLYIHFNHFILRNELKHPIFARFLKINDGTLNK